MPEQPIQQIPLVALLDDNEGTNYIHRKYLEKSGLVGEVRSFSRPAELLRALSTRENWPSVLLIDMNMGSLNAFEFLEHLAPLLHSVESPDTKIYLLSVSLTPAQERLAKQHPLICRSLEKPLRNEDIHAIHREFILQEMLTFV